MSALRIFMLAITTLGGAAAHAVEPTADAIADKVQARYESTRDFTAAVRQELSMSSGGKTASATGTVAFKKPGKMRWDLRDGTTQVIVADGRTLWFYEPEEKQVLKAPFQAAFHSTTPISFLTGVGRLRDDFTATAVEPDGATWKLELTPRSADADLGKLRLSIDTTTYDIVGAEVIDPVGNRTRLFFSDLKRNVRLDDDAFHFDVPAGVDVVEAPIGN